jgi:prepilin-type N-terminal cleavage/methylation domain-containing protein
MERTLQRTTARGFTLLETVIVVAIIGSLAVVSMVVLQGLHRSSALRVGGSEVYRALTDARSKTLSSDGDTVYGVRIASTSVTRFEGATYSAGNSTNEVYTFEAGVTATGTIVTGGTSIVFRRLTGEPSATGTVYVRNESKTATTTVVVHASGLVE